VTKRAACRHASYGAREWHARSPTAAAAAAFSSDCTTFACEAHLRLCFDRLEAYHGQIPQQPVRGCQTRSHSHALGSGGTADGTCSVARRLGRKRILLRRVVAGTGNDQDVSVTSKGSTKFTRAEQSATGTVQVVRSQVEDLGMRRDPTC
jgi:hypothetical protein